MLLHYKEQLTKEDHMQRTSKLGVENEKFLNVKAIYIYSNHVASKF